MVELKKLERMDGEGNGLNMYRRQKQVVGSASDVVARHGGMGAVCTSRTKM